MKEDGILPDQQTELHHKADQHSDNLKCMKMTSAYQSGTRKEAQNK